MLRAGRSHHIIALISHLLYVLAICELVTCTEQGIPIEIKLWESKRSPLAHMVDVTNEFGLKVLAEHNFLNDNNIAFSPYGLMGILVALYEGVDGESSYQIQRSMQLPWNRNVMRIGFRDIHRTLKTYFVPEEGFLAGLALNNENVTFNESYKKILQFYGFDLESDQPPKPTQGPQTTTVSSNSNSSTATTLITIGEKVTNREDSTTKSTTKASREETTLNPQAETIDIREQNSETPTTALFSTSATSMSQIETTTINGLITIQTSNTASSGVITEPTISTPKVTLLTDASTEQIISQESTVTSAMTSGSTDTSTMTSGSTDTSTLTSGSTDTSTMTSGSTDTSTMTSGSTDTSTITSGSTDTSTITSGSTDTSTMTSGSTDTSTMTSGSTYTSTMTSGSTDTGNIASGSTDTSTKLNTFYTETSNIADSSITAVDQTSTILGTGTGRSDSSTMSTMSTLETLERRKKSVVDFLFTSPPYADDYLVYRSFDIGTDLPNENSYEDDKMFMANGLRNIQVTYMHYDSVMEYAYLPHLEASALRLPLDSEKYYLLVILPTRRGAGELGRLLARMARESDLSDVYAALHPRRVRAMVPSFIVKGHVTLTTDLQKIGIRDVFEPRQHDFTPMTQQPGVYVRSIEQAVSVAIRKYQPDVKHRYITNRHPVLFSATYPFVYFVMDTNIHVALMAGKMVDPLNTRIL